MNKSELVKEVSQISGVSSALVKIVLSQALVSIATHTAAGDSVMISGFGTFTGRQRAVRREHKSQSDLPAQQNGMEDHGNTEIAPYRIQTTALGAASPANLSTIYK